MQQHSIRTKVAASLVAVIAATLTFIGVVIGAQPAYAITYPAPVCSTSTAYAVKPCINVSSVAQTGPNTYAVTVIGSHYTIGGQAWVGIADWEWNPTTHTYRYVYRWGARPTVLNYFGAGLGFFVVTVTVVNPTCSSSLDLASTDLTTGAYTPDYYFGNPNNCIF